MFAEPFAALLWLALLTSSAAAVTLGLRLRACRQTLRTLSARIAEQRVEERALIRAQATLAERERIYADLHDDLGAKLLALVYRASSPQNADLARSILQDLRDVVTRSRGEPGQLADVLEQIEAEARGRLTTVGMALDWEAQGDLPPRSLDQGEALHLFRIVREAISNAIRHSQAARLRVRVHCTSEQLRIEITDDGSGAALISHGHGRGMQNMRDRAAELHGDINWTPGTEGGTKVLLTMPLGDLA